MKYTSVADSTMLLPRQTCDQNRDLERCHPARSEGSADYTSSDPSSQKRSQDDSAVKHISKMTKVGRKQIGFTLLEMLLVLAIMAVIMVMILNFTTQRTQEMRRDRIVLQMQQVLNAALSFYVNNGRWPVPCGDTDTTIPLTSADDTFLKSLPGLKYNPYGVAYTYSIGCQFKTNDFVLSTAVPNATEATIVASRLPIGQATDSKITTQVSIPGQNLSNARSVNFANIYHPNACVPAPQCPTGMTSQIMVIPVDVSGYNDQGKTTVNPISSFTAYAVGDTVGNKPVLGGVKVSTCGTPVRPSNCQPGDGNIDPNTKYWRVCLRIVTDKGPVDPNATETWAAEHTSVLAITRCAPPGEPIGSGFNVWTQP